jgi:hypothetical protein
MSPDSPPRLPNRDDEMNDRRLKGGRPNHVNDAASGVIEARRRDQ